MKSFVAILALLLWATSAMAAVKCDLPELDAVEKADPQCLFYTGTQHFREKSYESAVTSWKQLVALSDVPLEHEHLRTDAHNNLGYMYFMGWGVAADRKTALEYWSYAYKAGHEESAYHLCHYYGEPKEPVYRRQLAKGYCKEALRRYEQLGAKLNESAEVIRQLNGFMARLSVE